jgi:hypothetical protein
MRNIVDVVVTRKLVRKLARDLKMRSWNLTRMAHCRWGYWLVRILKPRLMGRHIWWCIWIGCSIEVTMRRVVGHVLVVRVVRRHMRKKVRVYMIVRRVHHMMPIGRRSTSWVKGWNQRSTGIVVEGVTLTGLWLV